MAKCQTIKKAFHPQRDEKPWYHPNSEDRKIFVSSALSLITGLSPRLPLRRILPGSASKANFNQRPLQCSQPMTLLSGSFLPAYSPFPQPNLHIISTRIAFFVLFHLAVPITHINRNGTGLFKQLPKTLCRRNHTHPSLLIFLVFLSHHQTKKTF